MGRRKIDEKDKRLTAQMERYCQEYMKSPDDQTGAATRAGYSAKTAAQKASGLMNDSRIRKRIAELMQYRNKRNRIDADYVLNQAVKIHERCMQEIEPFTDAKGNHIHDKDGRPLYVFDAKAAVSSLTLVGKHVDVKAFTERVEVSGKVDVVNKVLEARKRARGDLTDD